MHFCPEGSYLLHYMVSLQSYFFKFFSFIALYIPSNLWDLVYCFQVFQWVSNKLAVWAMHFLQFFLYVQIITFYFLFSTKCFLHVQSFQTIVLHMIPSGQSYISYPKIHSSDFSTDPSLSLSLSLSCSLRISI